MSKTDRLLAMAESNNGYLFTSDVQAASISRTFFAEFLRKNNYEKVAKGIYISADTWPDELYILQKRYPAIVFSGETALYLHSLLDREYGEISVAVPVGFSGSRLREEGVAIHVEREDRYMLGVTEIETQYGNTVRCYDRERCICDAIRNRKRIEVQNYRSAVLGYMKSRDKDLSRLVLYAQHLGDRDEVMKYVEVLT